MEEKKDEIIKIMFPASTCSSYRNENSILRSKMCGCYYCCKIFPPEEICEWCDPPPRRTAICPYCGIDSVIGDADWGKITEEMLKEMHKENFG